MKMDRRIIYGIGIIVVILIFASALVMNPGSDFGGADDAAGEQITEIDEDYEPWASNLWDPSPETESALFALQAAIGAGILGFIIGRVWKPKSRSNQEEEK
jgi:cobalt/nickel transport protein